MAERNLIFAAQTTGDTIDYKPLSLLAVAGLGSAVLYAVTLLVSASAAFFKNEPLFLSGWLMVIPIAGAALSGLGLWQIHGSEGTSAGAALAKWGMGISAVLGISYFTYETFTGLAILQQANRFVLEKEENSGFIPRLRGNEADFRLAFKYTLDFADTAVDLAALDFPTGQNPKGKVSQFEEHPLVRLLRQTAPSAAKIEPLAVSIWNYENRALTSRGYRITTEEGVYEVPITVSSIEPLAEGERRRWRVDWQPMTHLPPVSRTAVGVKRQAVRHKAMEFLSDAKTGWFPLLIRRWSFDVYLATQRPQDRPGLRQRAALVARAPQIALAGAAMAGLIPTNEESFLSQLLPGYRPMDKLTDYFKMDNLRVWHPSMLEPVRNAAKNELAPDRLFGLNSLKVLPNDLAPCIVDQGEVTITCQAGFVVTAVTDKGQQVNVLLQLDVVVAAPEDFEPSGPEASQQLRIKSVELVRAWPFVPQKQ